MGYTEFGKYIRKLMIDKNENLSDISCLLNVSIAFVSAVLIGKKQIPADWISIITKHYDLNSYQITELNSAYFKTKQSIKIDLQQADDERIKLAIQFQRKLPDLSKKEMNDILKILKEGDN